MSTQRLAKFYQTTLGKKVVMAVTGVVLVGFLVVHVLGNLQMFAGPDAINGYSEFLHHARGLLWGTRIVLLVALALHVHAAVTLYRLSRGEARPVRYAKKGHRGASLASLLMLPSGVLLFAFVVFHLLHFTTGTATAAFQGGEFLEGDVYGNLLNAFRLGWVGLVYLVAMALVGMHLFHGLWSMTQSLGASHPRWTARIRPVAAAVAAVLAIAFAVIPLAIMLGFGGK